MAKFTAYFAAGLLALGALVAPGHAAIAANELWRVNLLNSCVGFPCATLQAIPYASTYDICTVSNINDSGANSLRSCAESAASNWIVFSVNGTITLQSTIHVASNKVIDGRTADITFTTGASFPPASDFAINTDSAIFQIGHYTNATSNTFAITNIIITNFKFQDCKANAMASVTEWADTVWLDHFTMQHSTDEQIAIFCGNNPLYGSTGCQADSGANRAPDNVAVSYMKSLQRNIAIILPNGTSDCCVPGHNAPCPGFEVWCSKSLLLGSYKTQEAQMSVTGHHNWWATDARHPAMNNAQYHGFNNWYDGTQAGVNANNTNLCQSAKFVSENEILDKGTSPGYEHNPIIDGDIDLCSGVGPNTASITCTGSVLLNGATCRVLNQGTNFTPSSFYSYTPDSTTGLTAALTTQTGWQNVTAPTSSPAPVLRIIH